MKYLVIALLGLTSCTTLDALSGEHPTSYRAVYATVGQTTESEDTTIGFQLSLRDDEEDAWTSDISVDQIDGDHLAVGLGIRPFFNTEGAVQPYLGLGVSAIFFDGPGQEDEVWGAGYARFGLEYVVSGPWRVGLDWRGWAASEEDDSLVSLGLGWSF